MANEQITTQCCIAGGGPAGLMAGMLLARAGVNVIVLEKHADFLRDFRGDTIHPSIMEVMHELGWLDEFLRLPHYPARSFKAVWGGRHFEVASFRDLPAQAKFIAMMPQWDFLNFIAEKARAYPTFKLITRCEANALLKDGERITGVRASTADGMLEVQASLVIAADGRGSVLRGLSGLALQELGAPMDVLWLRLARLPTDSESIELRIGHGGLLVMINRGDYWQCAYVIPKGQWARVRARGLDAFRASLAQLSALDVERTAEIQSWDQAKLLNVQVNRLMQWWRDGLLCIGDAAHAMSPIGGVGVNLAVQDAVAAANLLATPLLSNTLKIEHLQRVQARREFPATMTQRMQVFMQNQVVKAALDGTGSATAPLQLRIVNRSAWLKRITGHVLGMGIRPEHISP